MSTPILPYTSHPSHYYPLPHLAPRYPPAPQLPHTPPTPQPTIPHPPPLTFYPMMAQMPPPYMGASKVQQAPIAYRSHPLAAPFYRARMAAAPPPGAPRLTHTPAPWVNFGIDPKLIYSPPKPAFELDDDEPFASQPETMSFSPTSGSELSFTAPPTPDMSPIVSAGLISQMPSEEDACVPSPTFEDEYRGGKRRRTSISYVPAPTPAVEEEEEEDEEDEEEESEVERVGRKRGRRAADDEFKPSRTAKRAGPRTANKKTAKPAKKVPVRNTKPLPARARPSAATTKKAATTHATSTRAITVFACPYHHRDNPSLTCGAFFRTEADVRRHATKHLVKEFYASQDGELPASDCFFGAREPALLYCPNSWCGRPFARKDAYNRHIAEACDNISERSAAAKKDRLVQAREQAKCADYWVETPERMPRSVDAVVGRVQGQQKPVILSIERVLSTYDERYDLKVARDGETEEVWWYREPGRGSIKIFEKA